MANLTADEVTRALDGAHDSAIRCGWDVEVYQCSGGWEHRPVNWDEGRPDPPKPAGRYIGIAMKDRRIVRAP